MDHPLKIMLVDDESIVGKRLKPSLEKSGYEVEVFEDGQGAIDRLSQEHFDILVTDVRMDEVDGLEVLAHAIARSKRTKVIIITGYATVELARETLVKGAFDFIAKPFKPADLRKIIEQARVQLEKDDASG